MPNATSAHQLITLGQADERYVLPLVVITTQVGNVGAGTDDLITYSLPANALNADGKGVRVTAWGVLTNNANAKTITVNFGSTVMASNVMSINANFNWKVVADIFRSASNAQAYIAEIRATKTGTVGVRDFDIESGAATETDSSAITIKCTGTAVADNDIIQKGMLVELIGSSS